MENEQTQTEGQETLVLADVILMHNIIATVSRRGAFEAAEMEVVGKLFNKLTAFLPKNEQQEGEAAETTNTSEEVAQDGQTQFEFVEEAAPTETPAQ
jgi:hypothetical protein